MIEMVVGAALVSGGMIAGRVIRFSARQRSKSDQQPVPICGCMHNLAFHDPKSGKCSATSKMDKYSSIGTWAGIQLVECACRQYMGPIPYNPITLLPMIELATTYTPPSLGSTDEPERARGGGHV